MLQGGSSELADVFPALLQGHLGVHDHLHIVLRDEFVNGAHTGQTKALLAPPFWTGKLAKSKLDMLTAMLNAVCVACVCNHHSVLPLYHSMTEWLFTSQALWSGIIAGIG